VDYAYVLKELADIHFANTKTIVLVQDNLNIHSKASLYEAFPAAEARRLNTSNGTTPPSTAAGSIWRNPNSASYRPSASTAASPTNKPSLTKDLVCLAVKLSSQFCQRSLDEKFVRRVCKFQAFLSLEPKLH
jgi:hypothetical protein